MAFVRGWSVSYLRPTEDPSRRPFSVVLEYRTKQEALLFDSGAIAELTNQDYALIKDRYMGQEHVFGCLGIYSSSTYDHTLQMHLSYLVVVTECRSVVKLPSFEVYRISNVRFICLNIQNYDDESNNEIKKLLTSGAFYFAKEIPTGLPYDLTRSAQSHYRLSQDRENLPTFGTFDQRFLWNRGLMSVFSQQGIAPSKWLCPIICGSFGVSTVYAPLKAQIGIVSRVSTLRPGTRFNTRGVDDNGFVANFVETESFIYVDNQVLSHIQIRGTVPLFWCQPGIQLGSHKIKILRFTETSLGAFNRHFSEILSRYGETVIVDLMGSKEGESGLSKAYSFHLSNSDYRNTIYYVHFDYHTNVNARGVTALRPLYSELSDRLDTWGYFHIVGKEVKRFQTGVVRTNCVDCLDRTNAVQSMISIMLIHTNFLSAMNISTEKTNNRIQESFATLWLENGDDVSRIYTGTGALSGERSKLKNAQRSATRTIRNNFFDSAKQEAMLALLNQCTLVGWQRHVAGQYLPSRLHFLPQSVLKNILERNSEFTRTERLKIFIGTWNVNGGTNARSLIHREDDLTSWLFDLEKNVRKNWGFRNSQASPDAFARPIDIYAIGFEEIIDLNAGNVVAGKQSSENQNHWGTKLQKMLDTLEPTLKESYVLVCTTQLVGVCIFVFVRLGLCEYIRGLSSASVKTGLHGTAGNKGAVAVRFQIGATSLCFCCSHLTAGQSAVRERNAEFADIKQRLQLTREKRSVLMHNYVFWFGDLNYRIDLPGDEVKSLVERSAWLDLLRSDQLSVNRDAKNVFDGFHEGPVMFAPTYKYDLFSEDYDTSEKARIPAWTDRVLWSRANLSFTDASQSAAAVQKKQETRVETTNAAVNKNLLLYHRAELKTSDHRPVAAVFDIDIQVVETLKRRKVLEEELLSAGPGDATVSVEWTSEPGCPPVDASEIYHCICELATSAGTIVLARVCGNNKLLLTFSKPYESMEAVRMLNCNSVSVERDGRRVSLQVCLKSAPKLNIIESCSTLESALDAASDEPQTRHWLSETSAILEVAEQEYVQTHGVEPRPEIFRPIIATSNNDNTAAPALLRIDSDVGGVNLRTDQEKRRMRVAMLSMEDQTGFINILSSDDYNCRGAERNRPQELPPKAPPRPPPIVAAASPVHPLKAQHTPPTKASSHDSQLPITDVVVMSRLLASAALTSSLHPAQSCNDLFAGGGGGGGGGGGKSGSPSLGRHATTLSTHSSPSHEVSMAPPPHPPHRSPKSNAPSTKQLIELFDDQLLTLAPPTTPTNPPADRANVPPTRSLPAPLVPVRVPPPLPARPAADSTILHANNRVPRA